jgi:hypothetical protein
MLAGPDSSPERSCRFMTPTLVAVVIPFAVIGLSDIWVFRDATAKSDEGAPVVLSSPFLTLETAESWTIACLLAWIVFFPLYLTGRRQ